MYQNHKEMTHLTGARYLHLQALEIHNLRQLSEANCIKSKVLASIDGDPLFGHKSSPNRTISGVIGRLFPKNLGI
jgi:hypothetical protein